MKKQMTKNIKKAMILFWAVICILGIKGNVYAQDIKLVAPIITSSQMENGNFVIRWRTSEELKGQEYKIYCATSKDGTYEYVTTTPDYSYTEYYPNKGMAYYYKITTVYTDYETEREIESNPVYTGGIVNPLEIPTITEAKAGNNHSVTIMWNKTEDCLGYAIYRSGFPMLKISRKYFGGKSMNHRQYLLKKILNWEKHIIIKSDHMLHILKERFMVIFQTIKAVKLQLMEQR